MMCEEDTSINIREMKEMDVMMRYIEKIRR